MKSSQPGGSGRSAAEFALFAAAALSALAVRLPTLSTPVQGWDEAWFFACGRALLEGGPYALDFTVNPWLALSGGLFHLATGVAALKVRLGTAMLGAVVALLVIRIGRWAGFGPGAALGGLVGLYYAGLPQFQGELFGKELLAMLCVAPGFLLLSDARNRRRVLAAGLFLGLGFTLRQTVALYGLVAAGWLVHAARPLPLHRRAGLLLLFLAGCAAPVATEALAAASVDRLHQDVAYYLWLIAYANDSAGEFMARFARILVQSGPVLLPLLFLGVCGMVLAWRRGRADTLLLIGWAGAALVDVIAPANFFPHYVLVLFPAWGLFAGLALWQAWGALRRRGGAVAATLLGVCLLAAALLPVGRPFAGVAAGPDAPAGDGWDPIWRAVAYVNGHRKPGEGYLALASHPVYRAAFGPAAIPRSVLGQEFFPPLPVFPWSGVTGKFFYEYSRRQAELLDLLRTNPPAWLLLTVHDDMPRAVQSFPGFFAELFARYRLEFSAADELVFRLAPVRNAVQGDLPPAVLARFCRIREARLDFPVLTLEGRAFRDDSMAVSARYVLPGPPPEGAQHGAAASVEDIPGLPGDAPLRAALRGIGLEVRPVWGYLREVRPEDLRPGDQLPNARLALVTSIQERGSRVFMSLGRQHYEGYGARGRLKPVYQGSSVGLFLLDDPAGVAGDSDIYFVGGGRATLYVGRFQPTLLLKNMPASYVPGSFRSGEGVYRVEWRPLTGSADVVVTTLENEISGLELPTGSNPVPFFKLPELVQKYLLDASGWDPAVGQASIEDDKTVLPAGNGSIRHARLFRDGELDMAGPAPDGIHRHLAVGKEAGELATGKAGFAPGAVYTLYVVFDSGRVLWQRVAP